MLLCKGRGCKYRKTCSRYVIGTAMANHVGENDTYIDHCLHARKFEKYANKQDQDGACSSDNQREHILHEHPKYNPINGQANINENK